MADDTATAPTETASLCPFCLRRVGARRVTHGNEVRLIKQCPEHGEISTVIWRGAPAMTSWDRPKTPSRPPVCFTEVDRGCPFDCGLCPEHGQHSCSALMEITQRCNMHCPVCFADSGNVDRPDPTLATIDDWYRSARHACGDHIVIQLSGGEPTVREDLPDIVALGRRHGFSFIQLNTNGLRLAEDPAYARQLAEAGLANVFLQFDGTEDAIYLRLRGRTMLEQKRRAIDHASAAGLGVVLVPTLVPGINTDNIGAILDFGLRRAPGVRGVHFQPISYFGRFPAAPADEDRITLPEILQAIERQTAGRMQVAHFAPPGCEHSLCSFHGNFVPLPNGRLHPLTNAASNRCCKPIVAAEGARKSPAFLTRQWAAPASQNSKPCSATTACSSADTISLDDFLDRVTTHTFAVSAMAFQDVWNIDLERTRNCCIHVVTPEGHLVPFCLYNLTSASGATLYRGRQDAHHPPGSLDRR
jgi:hypothetical protein